MILTSSNNMKKSSINYQLVSIVKSHSSQMKFHDINQHATPEHNFVNIVIWMYL